MNYSIFQKKKNINKSLQNKFIGPCTIISILDNHINYIIKAANKKSKSITIVDHSLNNDKTSTKLIKDRTLKLKIVKPDINNNGDLPRKRGRPKKLNNTTSSNTIQSYCEIIIKQLQKFNTDKENTIIKSVSIVNAVQSPQNNIVL